MLDTLLNFFRKNIQTNQTLFLSIILIVGIQFYPLHYNYTKLFVVFSTVIFIDYFLNYLKTGKHIFPFS